VGRCGEATKTSTHTHTHPLFFGMAAGTAEHVDRDTSGIFLISPND